MAQKKSEGYSFKIGSLGVSVEAQPRQIPESLKIFCVSLCPLCFPCTIRLIEAISSLSLRRVLLQQGVDLRLCRSCGVCSEYTFTDEEADLALGIVVQLVLLNDPEVFTSRTIWSDEVVEAAGTLCPNGVDLKVVLQTLREQAVLRGYT